MVLSILLLVAGALTLIGAIQAAASVRRFSSSAILSRLLTDLHQERGDSKPFWT
jgi:hypothetical protein